VTRLIEDYALLSDLQTAALVHREGSIDWCCLPRYDSDACFAALLGHRAHGCWLVSPSEEGEPRRRYREESLVLETEWETREGKIRVIDFMPPRGEAPEIVRIVEGVSGRVTVRSELVIRLGYGRTVPSLRPLDDAHVATAGPDALVLRTPAPTVTENTAIVATFDVGAGEQVPFTLTWFPSHAVQPPAIDPGVALRETETFWRGWSSRCSYDGPYREQVLRSLVVLKGLTYRPTGGIVAAPTTSLPESPGGERNWDYRYCWLRDAALTCSRSSPLATERRRALGAPGLCGRRPAIPMRSRSCTESRASDGCASGWSSGFRASRTRTRSGSATPPPSRSSSTSTAR
jgi:GH15 family glucan-1,4-alpha-glucosidase